MFPPLQILYIFVFLYLKMDQLQLSKICIKFKISGYHLKIKRGLKTAIFDNFQFSFFILQICHWGFDNDKRGFRRSIYEIFLHLYIWSWINFIFQNFVSNKKFLATTLNLYRPKNGHFWKFSIFIFCPKSLLLTPY